MKRVMIPAILALALICFVGCAAQQRVERQAEIGKEAIISLSVEEAVPIVVRALIAEGFVPQTINEKYGIIIMQPKAMHPGTLMKKIGQPGGGIVSGGSWLTPEMTDEVNLSCSVQKIDEYHCKVNIKTTVFHMQATTFGTRKQLHVYRSAKANEYYFQKIMSALGQ